MILAEMRGILSCMRSECPITCALDVLGDHWSLVILRDLLLLRRRRFSELASEEGIASNILSDRLSRLEGHGLIRREVDVDDKRSRLVLPTEKSLDLIPLLLEFVVFGVDHCGGVLDDDFVRRARDQRKALVKTIRKSVTLEARSA